MENDLNWTIMTKVYSYLIDDSSEDKINRLKKSKIDIDCITENHKQFIRNNKSILKTQQRFKSERHTVFTEEINKTALKAH